jgi:hypothetical protein
MDAKCIPKLKSSPLLVANRTSCQVEQMKNKCDGDEHQTRSRDPSLMEMRCLSLSRGLIATQSKDKGSCGSYSRAKKVRNVATTNVTRNPQPYRKPKDTNDFEMFTATPSDLTIILDSPLQAGRAEGRS